MFSRKFIYRIAFLALFILIIAALFIFKFSQFAAMGAMMKAMGENPISVSVATAEERQWQPYLRAVGNFAAVDGVDITSEAAGIIKSISFTPGSFVSKGAVLFQLNDSVDQAQLKDYQAALTLAKINYQRQSNLFKKNAVSKSAYDEAKAKLDQADAAVMRIQAQVAQKKITAPFDGQVGIRKVNLGQYISPGSVSMVTLQAMNPLLVNFAIPEQQIPQIKVGMQVELAVEAFSDRSFSGKIIAIDAEVNPKTHNIRVQATVPNDEQLLYPGMFANVSILLDVRRQVIVVPQTAVLYSLYGNEVFVLYEDKDVANGEVTLRVKRRFVTVGEERGSEVIIESGLQPGDRVVDAGQHRLYNEKSVVINEEAILEQSAETLPQHH